MLGLYKRRSCTRIRSRKIYGPRVLKTQCSKWAHLKPHLVLFKSKIWPKAIGNILLHLIGLTRASHGGGICFGGNRSRKLLIQYPEGESIFCDLCPLWTWIFAGLCCYSYVVAGFMALSHIGVCPVHVFVAPLSRWPLITQFYSCVHLCGEQFVAQFCFICSPWFKAVLFIHALVANVHQQSLSQRMACKSPEMGLFSWVRVLCLPLFIIVAYTPFAYSTLLGCDGLGAPIPLTFSLSRMVAVIGNDSLLQFYCCMPPHEIL